MYIGHAGLALFAKSRRARLSLALLVAVAFAPDWIEWAFGAKGGFASRGAVLSHSIPAVLVGAALVAGGALLARCSRGDALALFALYLSHWAVDFVTGVKPTWPGGPALGLSLYDRPWLDFAVESVLALACAVAYLRTLPRPVRRVPAWSLLTLVVVLQAAFDVGLRSVG